MFNSFDYARQLIKIVWTRTRTSVDKEMSSNEVRANVKKTNTDFGISIWNIEYVICLFWFLAGNHLPLTSQ